MNYSKHVFNIVWPYNACKDLSRGTASDKVLHDKVFEIDSIQKYDGYERGLVLKVYNFLIKNLDFWINQQLAHELYKLVNKKFQKRNYAWAILFER